MSKLSGVSDTLFIPLVARIYVSKTFPHYFYDEKSLQLEKEIPSDVIAKKSGQYELLASVARYDNFDDMIRRFIQKHGEVNIINLGCGLETAYYRIADPKATFYEIDFPDVIEHRRAALGEEEKEILLGYSLLDLNWVRHVDRSKPSLMIVSGVFQYLHEEDILRFLKDVRQELPGSEIAFDFTNSKGIKYTNKYVQKTGNGEAMMHFSIDDENEFAQKADAEILEYRVFFTRTRKVIKKGLTLYSKIAMWVCDSGKRASILHLKLK